MADATTRTINVHFYNWYDNGVGGDREGGRRLVHTLVVPVRDDISLRSSVAVAAAADPDILPALRPYMSEMRFALHLLPVGTDVSRWRPQNGLHTPEWQITESGRINRLDALIPGDFTSPQLDELVALGYAEGDPHNLVFETSDGNGGGNFLSDLVNWLLTHGVDIAVVYGLDQIGPFLWDSTVGRLRNSAHDRRARGLAAQWWENRIYTPTHLRHFIDLKDRWTLAEVETRLGLSGIAAQQLLISLGYERDAASGWRLGAGRKARSNRDKWLKNENDIYGGPGVS